MMPSIVNPTVPAAWSAVLAAILLCLGATILRADEGRLVKPGDAGSAHCRIYFGCLPVFAKERGRFN